MKIRKRKGTWEEQEQRDRFTKLRSMLRRAWLLDTERLAALSRARIPYNGENKRQKWAYICAYCKEQFQQKNVTVDHIIPCGSFLEPKDLLTFVPNLFCIRDHLQVLCKECHSKKTLEERKK